jgi:hypothetical protein
MAFGRRRVRLVGGDVRPVEERTGARSAAPRRGVGLVGPNGVLKSGLTPDQKTEIEERVRAKWERERESGYLARKAMRKEKKKAGRKKEKRRK